MKPTLRLLHDGCIWNHKELWWGDVFGLRNTAFEQNALGQVTTSWLCIFSPQRVLKGGKGVVFPAFRNPSWQQGKKELLNLLINGGGIRDDMCYWWFSFCSGTGKQVPHFFPWDLGGCFRSRPLFSSLSVFETYKSFPQQRQHSKQTFFHTFQVYFGS